VTGDRIDILNFRANGALLGSDIPCGHTDVEFEIEGLDSLDSVDLIKNGNIIKRFTTWEEPEKKGGSFLLRLCWGWGPGVATTTWSGQITLSDGALRRVVPIFGPPAPDSYRVEANVIKFASVTSGYNADWKTNRYRCGGECGLALVIDGDLSTGLHVNINGMQIDRQIGALLKGSEVHFLPAETAGGSWNVPKFKLYQCIPVRQFRMHKEFREPLETGDFLYLRIRQDNGQMAWTSPFFARP